MLDYLDDVFRGYFFFICHQCLEFLTVLLSLCIDCSIVIPRILHVHTLQAQLVLSSAHAFTNVP